jgi:hypothetical protein
MGTSTGMVQQETVRRVRVRSMSDKVLLRIAGAVFYCLYMRYFSR